MGALEANTTLIYGIHIRESANDGSDFSNGASDYRVLFLGEDGLLHLKDSAGTVTTPSAGGAITSSSFTMATDRLLGRDTAGTGAIEELTIGSGLSLSGGALSASGGVANGDEVLRTAGDVAITGSTNFTDVTGMSVSLTTGARRCLVGAVVSGYVNNAGGTMAVDIDVDGSRLGQSTGGLVTVGQHSTASESLDLSFVVMTDALSAASHTFKLQGKVFNSAHTFTVNGADPGVRLWVMELPF